ncbi:predicted protein [Naegleria gruberi]|nr:uncharacterized protein NAEGRDRAFT_76172 [Naegleria gruberi]EFC36154.1 predicted protein [Naegleria gruberi]|eukprot:XP_002668898.1 predicted protein [Naegleria gruberi strain NEG-M]
MPQQFLIVLEKCVEQDDGSNEIWSQFKCSDSVFEYVFGIEYPTGTTAGERIARIPTSGANLDLYAGIERIFNKNGQVVSKLKGIMTNGSWTLFQLLSDKGFKLAEQRNYDVVQFCSTLNGRKLVERIFVRDL